jgi:hypothetical protein
MEKEPDSISGSSRERIPETLNLQILLSRAMLVNESSPERFDFDFTSLLISFLITNSEISQWFRKYIKENRIRFLDILKHKDLNEKKLTEIQERPIEKFYGNNPNITRSAQTIIGFAKELLQATRQSKNQPLDVAHIMGAYIYHQTAHRGQLLEWKFNFEDWSNSFLEQISSLYPLEIVGWTTVHIYFLKSVPKIKLEGIENLEGISSLEKGKVLDFSDIFRINYLTKNLTETSNSRDLLSAIYRLLNEDLEIRNANLGVNYLDELYKDESLLPANFRLTRPNPESSREIVDEKIRAIVLGEYERLYDIAIRDFINRKINHEEYSRKIRKYTNLAHELWI